MIPVNGDFQVNIVGRLYGQITVTTFFYKLLSTDPSVTGAEPAPVAELFAAGLASQMIDLMSQDWKGLRVEVRDPRTAPIWAGGETPYDGNGTRAVASLPPSVAGVITRRSGLAGRSNRGRVYIPAVPSDWHEDGELTGPGILVYGGFADNMATTVDLDGIDPALTAEPRIWSRKNQLSVKLTSCVVRWILRSQRRREIGVGI